MTSTHPAEPHVGAINTKLNWLRAGVLGANDGIVSVAGIVSCLGEVENLSVLGARVRGKKSRQPGVRLRIVLFDGNTSIALQAEVAWCQRAGWFRHEIGLAFRDLTDADRRTLTRLSSACRDKLTIAHEYFDDENPLPLPPEESKGS